MKGVIHHIILPSSQRRSMQVIDAVKVYSALKLNIKALAALRKPARR